MTPIIPLNDTPVSGGDDSTEEQFIPPTPEQRAQVSHTAHLGLRPSVIAAIFGVSLAYLVASYGPELSHPTTAPQKVVLRSLYELAARQKSAAATIFWIKNFASHLLPPPSEDRKASSQKTKPPEVHPKRNSRLQFTVYNNDHEPNHPL
jgi:hypothetical protein